MINCPDDAVDDELMRVAENPAADHREWHSFFAEVHRRQERAEVRSTQKLPAERLRRPGDGLPLPIPARSESRGEDLGYPRFTFDHPVPRVAENDLCIVVHADTDLIEVLLNCSSGHAEVSDSRGLQVAVFHSAKIGGQRFGRLRKSAGARAFLDGAGPAAIGAILGATIPLAGALVETWQYAVLAGAAVALLVLRRGVVPTLLCAGAVGVVIALAGGPLP